MSKDNLKYEYENINSVIEQSNRDEVDSILLTSNHHTKNLYKVQKLEENNSNFLLLTQSKVQQLNDNLVMGTNNQPSKKNYSLFDEKIFSKFFYFKLIFIF
jgi:hypothetical protein